MRRIRTIETASSMKNVPLGRRKMPAVVMMLPFPGVGCGRCGPSSASGRDALGGEDVDEHDHEQQVDEVHGLDQSDGQEEVLACLRLDLGLPGDGCDRLRTGQAVADRRTDGATAEGQPTTDEGTGDPDRTFSCSCHVSLSPLSRSCVDACWVLEWRPSG